jgi:uncharacterized repeat protein (TIGR03803 family)
MNATKAIRLPATACQISRGLLLAIAVALGARLSTQAQNYIYQQLFAFQIYAGATNGTSPRGALVQGSDGNFYGTCYFDGQPTSNCPTCGYGTVFRMSPDGALTTIAWFHGTTGLTNGEGYGGYPFGGMTQATNGNFYGDSEYGLFRVTPDGTLTARGGGSWVGDPIQGSDGYLYYVNSDTVFRSPLEGDQGMQWQAPGNPSGGLVQATDGNFYGLTVNGGTSGFGTAYKLTPGGVLTTLVSFGGTNSGRWPFGKMLQASDGNLYGVCDSPEQVFKLTLSGTLTTFAVFGTNGDRGTNPNAGLIEANDGNFYGTTFEGGGIGGAQGTVFKITPQGRISTLVVFSYRGDYPGSGPFAGLVQGSDGNLYGTCAYGGDFGGGNIFRILMPGPLLTSWQSGGHLILSWRTNYLGFTLQGSDGLSPPNWTDCTNSPGISAGQFWVTNSLSSGSRFFRLRK